MVQTLDFPPLPSPTRDTTSLPTTDESLLTTLYIVDVCLGSLT